MNSEEGQEDELDGAALDQVEVEEEDEEPALDDEMAVTTANPTTDRLAHSAPLDWGPTMD